MVDQIEASTGKATSPRKRTADSARTATISSSSHDTNAALAQAVGTFGYQSIGKIAVRLASKYPTFRTALMKGIAMDVKANASVECSQCHDYFNPNAKGHDGECIYHDGAPLRLFSCEIVDEKSLGELEEDFTVESWDELGPYTSEADEQERMEELSYMYKWTCCGKPGDDGGGCVKTRHEEESD
jgi:hypothetical protein